MIKLILDKQWISGKSFGASSFDSGYTFFPSWKLENWESFCISASTDLKSYKTFINDREVFTMDNYKGTHKKRPGNIFLLNAFFKQSGFVYPMEASVTDVNIWSRVLSPEQIRGWSDCSSTEGGDFISWESSDISHDGVTVQSVEKENICSEKKFLFMAFGNKLSFPETRQFCNNLDGEIATTVDAQSSLEIKNAFEKIGEITQVYMDCFLTLK